MNEFEIFLAFVAVVAFAVAAITVMCASDDAE